MTHEGDSRPKPSEAPNAAPGVQPSPWEAFGRPRASSPADDGVPAQETAPETLDDDDEMPELGDEDEIDDRDLTSPAAPIALRGGSRPSLPAPSEPPRGAPVAPRPVTLPPPTLPPVRRPVTIPPPLPVPAADTGDPAPVAPLDLVPLPALAVAAQAPLDLAPIVPLPADRANAALLAPPTEPGGPEPLLAPAQPLDAPSPAAPVALPAAAPEPFQPAIYEVPGATKSALLHAPLVFVFGGLGLALAVLLAEGSPDSWEPLVGPVCVLGVLSGIVHFFAAFPTILAARPPTKTLLVSASFSFAFCALGATFYSRALRRMTNVSDLTGYPEIFCIAATFSATAFLGAAVASRTSLGCLLGLRAPADPRDEIAESRALLAMLTGVGAAATIFVACLLLRLPITPAVPALMVVTVLGGAIASRSALAEGLARVLPEVSPLRARLIPRISLSQHAFHGAAFLFSLVAAMSMRVALLKAILKRSYAHDAGLGATLIDRPLLVLVMVLTIVASAPTWLPRLALPRAAEGEPLVPARGRRIALVFALISLGLLLRAEDVYERRVSSARDNLVVQVEKARDE